ncbi:MAG: HAD hydrolase-like protein, partial [Hyphomicrobiaceae bacterium]|nr:HAD hydrolase-like protein [Hyphomicrobiaceae bacterium]
EGVARALPFVCANPDLIVDVGAVQLPCAGSIAAEYERLGGHVFWAGKPHPAAYRAALAMAAELRGATPALGRILAVGDAVRTDLAAAHGFGVDGLFITAGIHKNELMTGDAIDATRLARLFSDPDTPPAIAATPELAW